MRVLLRVSVSALLTSVICLSGAAGQREEEPEARGRRASDDMTAAGLGGETLALGLGGWVERAPRAEYDWRCWMINPKYNCKGDTRVPSADSWTHVPNVEDPATSWRDVVERAGGHLEVARRHRARCNPDHARGTTNIVFVGNSFMRQVYEAVACRWAAHVTVGTIYTKGPILTRAEQQKYKTNRNAFPATAFQLMNYTKPLQCQIGEPARLINSFYFGGVEKPLEPTLSCYNSVGMTEINGTLRVYNLFRPSFAIGGIPAILTHLGLALDEIDVIVCNVCKTDGLEGPNLLAKLNRASPTSCEVSKHPGALLIDFTKVRATLQEQQTRDVGHLYGATNKFHKDDGHPCLPGIPDDEVDIIFAALLTRSGQISSDVDPAKANWWNETEVYGGAPPDLV